MTGRRVGWLLLAAIVIVALGFWASSHRGSAKPDAAVGKPVLAGLKAQLNTVTEVRISRGNGARVTLRKRPKDWEILEREYPADASKVRKILIDLGELTAVEVKTSDPQKYSQLGVADVTAPTETGTRIEVVTPGKTHGVIVGKSSGMKSGYVRATDAKQSLLATPQIVADPDPKRWLDSTVVDIPESRIKEVEMTPASGPAYRAAREKKEQIDFTVPGLPKGRELATPSAANPLASALVLVTLDDVRRAPAADAAQVAKPERVVFRTFDGLEIQLEGVKDGDRRYISLVAASSAKETAAEAESLNARLKGWQFEIANYKYDGMFRPLEELLAKLPEKEKKKK